MSLTERQKRHLQGLAHHLKPVVMVGQAGLTEGVLNEVGVALDHHELIKIKLAGGGRAERLSMIAAIAEQADADQHPAQPLPLPRAAGRRAPTSCWHRATWRRCTRPSPGANHE